MPLNLNQPGQPIIAPGPIDLSAAKNETVGFSLQISGLPPADRKGTQRLRITPPRSTAAPGTVVAGEIAAWQILPMPVDLNRAGYVRHTGLTIDALTLPRALLPLAMKNGTIDLSALRDPNQPTRPTARADDDADTAAQIWIDLHLPADTPAGAYTARCDLLDEADAAIASVEIRLTVYDFALPNERHLQLISPLDWDRLIALHRDRFETVRPTLLNRAEPRYKSAVDTLDQLVTLAQKHRCQVIVPGLGPRVKWPPGQPPAVEWDDYVAVVSPWLNGEGFADKMPLGFWPMPQPEMLDRFDRQSQLDYWQNAANRFDQNDWLPQSAVLVEPLHPGRAGAGDSVTLSRIASQLLACQSRLRVALPLEEDQLVLAGLGRPNMIDPRSAGRLLCSAPSLVFAPPIQNWQDDIPRPRQFLRTDLPGLLPYTGAGGNERDVQLLTWLAYLRRADLVLLAGSLPQSPDPAEPADPTDLVWFYPGHWFGVDEPLPSLQLKWLRRAQQDYEYLWLAKSRGEQIWPLLMARAITKPVQILNTSSPDPVYTLMSGTADPAAWTRVKELLARRILLRNTPAAIDRAAERDLNLDWLHWLEPRDRQFQLARAVQYLVEPGARELTVRVGLDIYNASDERPDANQLAWAAAPRPWTFRPQPQVLPPLDPFQVHRSTLEAKVGLERLTLNPIGSTGEPIEWTFTNGFTKKTYPMRAVIPVAPIDRRTRPLEIDGSLGEWDAADTIQDGPLVRMIDRPTLQKQQLKPATNDARLYAGWGDESVFLAFRLSGVTAPSEYKTQNFVNYQDRRAWGEDLCEMLVQAQYEDNTLGPVLHVVCKPTGMWVEKKLNPRMHADPWTAIEGHAIRYAGTVDGSIWRGELALPWKALLEAGKGRPTLLRFNVVHHVGATGESAGWAGPVDYGRDESFMGALYLRDLDVPPRGTQTLTESGR